MSLGSYMSGVSLEASGGTWEASRRGLGGIWEASGEHLGGQGGHGRLLEENVPKPCCFSVVNEKSNGFSREGRR